MMIDATGFSGQLFHYVNVIFFAGSAFLIFIFLWKRGRLDMDEEPSLQMMHPEDENG